LLNSLLSTLKPRQLEAIKHTQAPQLILAGAGTGKTITITAKTFDSNSTVKNIRPPVAQVLGRLMSILLIIRRG